MPDQSKSNREVIDEIKTLLKTLRRDVDTIRRDVSVIKNHQIVKDGLLIANKSTKQEEEPKKQESSYWFW